MSTISTRSAGGGDLPEPGLGLGKGPVRWEAVVEVQVHARRDHVAGHPGRGHRHVEGLQELQALQIHLLGFPGRHGRQPGNCLGDGVVTQPGAGAVGGRANETDGRVDRSLAAELQLQVGRFQHHGEFGVASHGSGIEHVLETVVDGRTLLLVVEHPDHVVGACGDRIVLQHGEHHRQARLHVRSPEADDPAAFEAAHLVALGRDGIQVPVQGDLRLAGRASHHQRVAHPGDGVGPESRGQATGHGRAQLFLFAGDRRDRDQPEEVVDDGGHTGTSKVRSASLSEVFSSVAAERRPMISAAGM